MEILKEYPVDLNIPIAQRRKTDSNQLVGSVNGLICFVIENNVIFLWNPSLRKYMKLPNPRLSSMMVRWRSYDFGYDRVTNDYKPWVAQCL
ncbi:hypothetical protein H5410_035820 [Solanum commersonii]|uniref:F-box associated beta-propeller type 3 domain-containing protein n=1 Tax=Solanum commersonii TaxID=4109 RepID=A0A9J5Y5U2_SOLCO|nr:hypothetical protein H5410_035820 [Solanum commersonii]